MVFFLITHYLAPHNSSNKRFGLWTPNQAEQTPWVTQGGGGGGQDEQSQGSSRGRSVLPLSISMLSLRGPNEAEIIKPSSVTQNTPRTPCQERGQSWNQHSKSQHQHQQGFRSRKKGFRWGTGTWVYPHSLWDAAVNCQDADEDTLCPPQTRVLCLRQHLSSSWCPAWAPLVKGDSNKSWINTICLNISPAFCPILNVQARGALLTYSLFILSWHSDVQKWNIISILKYYL